MIQVLPPGILKPNLIFCRFLCLSFNPAWKYLFLICWIFFLNIFAKPCLISSFAGFCVHSPPRLSRGIWRGAPRDKKSCQRIHGRGNCPFSISIFKYPLSNCYFIITFYILFYLLCYLLRGVWRGAPKEDKSC